MEPQNRREGDPSDEKKKGKSVRESEEAADRDLERAKELLDEARRARRHTDAEDPFDRLGENKEERHRRDG